jgi:uncharacterized membrane protein
VSDLGGGRSGFVARPAIGILFMLASATLFPVMNGFVKMLSDGYPSEQIIWARNATHLIFVLALFAPRRGWSIFRTRRPAVQFGRSLMLLLSTVCFFTAVKYIHLGKAATIQFIAPFIVTLMAWRMLGEALVPARLIAVGLGFLGTVIVIRPGSAVFQWADLLPLASSFFYAAYQVSTRFVADKDTPETSVVYSALLIGFSVIGDTRQFAKVSFTVPPDVKSGSPESQAFSAPFVIDKKVPLEFEFEAPSLDNTWLAAQLDLVNEETGEVIQVSPEASYYSGVDDGERWSEGSRSASKQTAEVDPGRYVLRATPMFDAPSSFPREFLVTVKADSGVGLCCPFFVFVLLFAGPLFTAWRSSSFETRRWNDAVFQMVPGVSTFPFAKQEDDE